MASPPSRLQHQIQVALNAPGLRKCQDLPDCIAACCWIASKLLRTWYRQKYRITYPDFPNLDTRATRLATLNVPPKSIARLLSPLFQQFHLKSLDSPHCYLPEIPVWACWKLSLGSYVEGGIADSRRRKIRQSVFSTVTLIYRSCLPCHCCGLRNVHNHQLFNTVFSWEPAMWSIHVKFRPGFAGWSHVRFSHL